MPRSARIVVQHHVDESLEEKQPEHSAAAAALAVATGLEDPAISKDALAAAEESRRSYESFRAGSLRRGTFVVQDNGEFAFDDWLSKPRVKSELQKTESALSNVESADNWAGSIDDAASVVARR